MSERSLIFVLYKQRDTPTLKLKIMETLISKNKKKGTTTLINQLTKATGDALVAVEIVLVQRNQAFKPSTEIGQMVELSGVSAEELIKNEYYTEDGDNFVVEADLIEKPKKEKKEKVAKEPKPKKSPLALTEAEHEVLDAIIRSDYHDGREVINDPVWAITMDDVKEERVGNGARMAGAIKLLVNKEMINSSFEPSSEPGRVSSTMAITQKGWDAHQAAEIVPFKGVIKKFKTFTEEQLEELELESLKVRKEFTGEYVSFFSNVDGSLVEGKVTGTKIDKRTGYVYLNIKALRSKFNKRPNAVEVLAEAPAWAKAHEEAKATALAEKKAAQEAKAEARKKANQEKAAKERDAKKGKNNKNAKNKKNEVAPEETPEATDDLMG